jgi:hypothetical protein
MVSADQQQGTSGMSFISCIMITGNKITILSSLKRWEFEDQATLLMGLCFGEGLTSHLDPLDEKADACGVDSVIQLGYSEVEGKVEDLVC